MPDPAAHTWPARGLNVEPVERTIRFTEPTVDPWGRYFRYRYYTNGERDDFYGDILTHTEIQWMSGAGPNAEILPAEPPRPPMRQCDRCGREQVEATHFRLLIGGGFAPTCNGCVSAMREACQTVAEGGRRFGVEIEVNVDGYLEADDIAGALRQAGIDATAPGYSHEVLDGVWKIVGDGSVDGWEIVSPPLQWGQRAQVQTVCEVLSELNCYTGTQCGLHVHHDVNDLSLDDMKRVISNWHDAQPITDCLVDYRRRSINDPQWCSPFHQHEVADLLRAETTGRFVYVDRYRALNVSCFSNYGTFEVRQKEGTLDSEDILAWIAYGQGFIEAARQQRTVPTLAQSAERFIQSLPVTTDESKRALIDKIKHAEQENTTNRLVTQIVETYRDPDEEYYEEEY